MLEDYNNGVEIGRGGFGVVYRCENTDGEIVALKILQREYLDDNVIKRRFQREVRLHLKVANHPNIIDILDNDVNEGFYYVMPLASYDLEKYLLNNDDTDLKIYRQVLEAVKFSHDHVDTIIHRDLKPSNILIFEDKDNLAVISDFGLVKLMNRDSTILTRTTESLGTEGYMAPEQFDRARDVNQTADIYSLGKILYKILTKRIPYPTINYSAVPPNYLSIIIKACRINPEDRYQSVDDLINDIDSADSTILDPVQTINEEIEKIGRSNDFSRDNTEVLAELLNEHAFNDEIIREIVPRIPDQILRSLIVNHYDNFYPVVDIFTRQLPSDDLDYDYCDDVANFFNTIFNTIVGRENQLEIIIKLIELGMNHNRYPVGGVVGAIINRITDRVLLNELRDIFRANENIASWHQRYIDRTRFSFLTSNINNALL